MLIRHRTTLVTAFFLLVSGLSGCAKWKQALFQNDFGQAIDIVGMRGPEPALTTDGRKPLVITIENLKSPGAPVFLAFYAPTNEFLSRSDRYKVFKLIPNGASFTTKIYDLPYGDFAIAGFQDLDSNGDCNKNWAGLPSEPYGFSNSFKPTIRAPRFSECQFSYSATKNTANMLMIK